MAITVLVIEDVSEMQAMLEVFLEGIEGLKIIGQAKNGWEAKMLLDRHRPELVLLDEVLPGESSLDLLNDFNAQKIPVILITSLENPGSALPDGALARFQKPTWKNFEKEREAFEKLFQKIIPKKINDN